MNAATRTGSPLVGGGPDLDRRGHGDDPDDARVGRVLTRRDIPVPRGYRIADADGLASFSTIYPGCRSTAIASTGPESTSQPFFDDTLTDMVQAGQPNARQGQRPLRTDGEVVYASGGDRLLLDSADGATAGYSTTFPIGLQVA